MQRDKVKAYLGFALKAKKLTRGINAAGALKGKVYLLLADEAASENSKREIEKIKAKFACPLLFVAALDELVNKSECKLAAVTDGGLANAIIAAERA